MSEFGVRRLVNRGSFAAVGCAYRHHGSINLEGARIRSAVQLDVDRVTSHVESWVGATLIQNDALFPMGLQGINESSGDYRAGRSGEGP